MIGAVDSFWGHSLVPHELYTEWASKCRAYTGDADTDVQLLYSPVRRAFVYLGLWGLWMDGWVDVHSSIMCVSAVLAGRRGGEDRPATK